MRIEVGYGLEGALTDATTKRIIDEDITPKFKTGDFAGGVSAGIDRMVRVINGEKLPEPEPPHWQDTELLERYRPVQSVRPRHSVFIVGGALRATLGRLVGSAATGGFVGVLAWLLVGSLGAAAIVGVLAFALSVVHRLMPSGGSRGTRGGWSSGGSSG